MKKITIILLTLIMSACASNPSSGLYYSELQQASKDLTRSNDGPSFNKVIAMPFYVIGVTSMGLAYLLSQVEDCEVQCSREQQIQDRQRFLSTLGFGFLGYGSWRLAQHIDDE